MMRKARRAPKHGITEQTFYRSRGKVERAEKPPAATAKIGRESRCSLINTTNVRSLKTRNNRRVLTPAPNVVALCLSRIARYD
jgi:hypothetical protein